MPKRAVAAIVVTAIALALLFSFKTPADNASALGVPAILSPAPDASSGPGLGDTGPAASTAPSTAASLAPGATPVPTKAATKGSGTFTGSVVSEPFGEVQVQITMSAGKITDVTALQLPTHGRSGFISQSVAPILQGEALAAQSASIDTVSGATYTSDAYAQSLQSAIDQAHG
ncbi:MAG TPA: FMN-binding protein [Candidatus Limnocylindrales bacterium]|nr:FMN-binding protein [Candidatus Limnocylindrales bacterium]